MTTNIEQFDKVVEELRTIYIKKNTDYGGSFDDSLDEDGLLVAKIRLGDKFKRLSQLVSNEAQVDDETVRDTISDLANYAIMTLKWIDNKPVRTYGDVVPAEETYQAVTSPRNNSIISDSDYKNALSRSMNKDRDLYV